VIADYGNWRFYRVDDIDYDTKVTSKIEGTDYTYLEYYKEKYGKTISDKNQPLLVHFQKRKNALGELVIKIIHLVPELCKMTGLTDK